jgi:hypothetical protein
MTRNDAINLLKQHESELRLLGVLSLYLFGSTARDEATEASDVDLFFDYSKGDLSLYGLMDIKVLACSILGQSSDVITRSSLHPALRAEIETTSIRVF